MKASIPASCCGGERVQWEAAEGLKAVKVSAGMQRESKLLAEMEERTGWVTLHEKGEHG